MSASRAASIAASALWLLAGCGPDLGPCDMAVLGGSDVLGMQKPHNGQLVVEQACAGGRCHSANAKGLVRVGAPSALDFDVVPLDTSPAELSRIQRGTARVHENLDSMWAMVESGEMPPENQGRTFSAADKETLRNWLACDAPVIGAPQTVVIPDAGMGGPAWADVFAALETTTCLTCHSTAAGKTAGNGFVFGDSGDACGAYKNVVNKLAVTTLRGCKDMNLTLVTANDPTKSLLLQKVEGTQLTCGDPMPAGTALGPEHPAVKALRAWIEAGAMPPPGCTL